MIGSLRGTVLERGADGEVLLEVARRRLPRHVTPRTLAGLDVGTEAFLHVHHHIREDAQTLYGFAARDERVCFEALLGAHRVGPALALAILATHGPGELRRVVADGDVAALMPRARRGQADRRPPAARAEGPPRRPRARRSRADRQRHGAPTATQAVAEALAGLGYSDRGDPRRPARAPRRQRSAVLLRDALKVLAVRRA